MNDQLSVFDQAVDDRIERTRRNPRKSEGKVIPTVAAMSDYGGNPVDQPDGPSISVSVIGKPGRYSVTIIDNHRDPDTAYVSPMNTIIRTTDPLELVYLALGEYLDWKEAK